MIESIHENNRQEINRHTLYGLTKKIIQMTPTHIRGEKKDALIDISLRVWALKMNSNPRKLWRKFVKDFI